MPKIHIETWNDNTVLRTVSLPVSEAEIKKYKSLAQDMVKYIKNPDNAWVGLAAPQVGVNKRLIVVSLMRDYEDENYRTIAMFNPTIVEHSLETCIDTEGCLSVPGEKGEVKRWNTVRVTFLDIEGRKQILSLEDLAARIVQHEIDHLDGILFIDKVEEEVPEMLLQK
jgi:peptide deformylase